MERARGKPGFPLHLTLSDVNFRRISFILLGLSGAALLIKLYGPVLAQLL